MWHLSKFQQNYNIGPTQRHSTTLHLSNNSIIYMVHPKEHTLATPIISLFTFRLLENNLLKIFLLTLSKSFQRQKINKRFGWKLSFRYCNLYKALRDYNRTWISFFFGVQFSLKILRSANRMFFVILKLVNPIYNPHSSNIQIKLCSFYCWNLLNDFEHVFRSSIKDLMLLLNGLRFCCF